MRENTDQNNSEYRHFSRSVYLDVLKTDRNATLSNIDDKAFFTKIFTSYELLTTFAKKLSISKHRRYFIGFEIRFYAQ